ncbi:hypothetical protein K439DRAFT_310826 [Ramaria rubella]|nr:hypothetical protein K439DRAFT_310826 [Ramaria rubella]
MLSCKKERKKKTVNYITERSSTACVCMYVCAPHRPSHRERTKSRKTTQKKRRRTKLKTRVCIMVMIMIQSSQIDGRRSERGHMGVTRQKFKRVIRMRHAGSGQPHHTTPHRTASRQAQHAPNTNSSKQACTRLPARIRTRRNKKKNQPPKRSKIVGGGRGFSFKKTMRCVARRPTCSQERWARGAASWGDGQTHGIVRWDGMGGG